MQNARELMLGYIEGTAEQSASLFAEKGTLELPYLASIGLPPVLNGREEIQKFLTFLHGTLYPAFAFEGVKINIDTPCSGARRIPDQPSFGHFGQGRAATVLWPPGG